MQNIRILAEKVRENMARVMVGKAETMQWLLAALVAGGHVLLEDVPGTGKTMMAKSLARSLDCDFARISCTPDLLPADVTGTSVYNMQESRFQFERGPVFTNILLVDEINRATPRTQAALLECMEERQVTEGGVTHRLPPPFLVIATQNPVEIQGTFPLPEAQLDRFLMRLTPGYPSTAESLQMLGRFLTEDPLASLAPVVGREDILLAHKLFRQAEVSPAVRGYIVDICERTRGVEQVQLGASPRGMLSLLRACQALACVQGRSYVTPDDVKALAVPVLAHRVVVRGLYGQAGASAQVVREVLDRTPVPTEQAG